MRTAAASKVTGVAKALDPAWVIKHILPNVRAIAVDESQQVRAALASDIMGLAPLFGEKLTSEHLLDLLLQLLKDDYPDVRLNVIGKLEEVHI